MQSPSSPVIGWIEKRQRRCGGCMYERGNITMQKKNGEMGRKGGDKIKLEK